VSLTDDFKGWVNLRLNFRLKSYVAHHCDIAFTYSMFTSPLNIIGDQLSHFMASKNPFTS